MRSSAALYIQLLLIFFFFYQGIACIELEFERKISTNLFKIWCLRQDRFHTDYLLICAGHGIFNFSLEHNNHTVIAGDNKYCGYVEGARSDARFNKVSDVAQLSDTKLVVSDSLNNCLRAVDNFQTTIFGGRCGMKFEAFFDGQANEVQFNYPNGILRVTNSIYISDYRSNAIRLMNLTSKHVSSLVHMSLDPIYMVCSLPDCAQIYFTFWYGVASVNRQNSSITMIARGEREISVSQLFDVALNYPLHLAFITPQILLVANWYNVMLLNFTSNTSVNIVPDLNASYSIVCIGHKLYVGTFPYNERYGQINVYNISHPSITMSPEPQTTYFATSVAESTIFKTDNFSMSYGKSSQALSSPTPLVTSTPAYRAKLNSTNENRDKTAMIIAVTTTLSAILCFLVIIPVCIKLNLLRCKHTPSADDQPVAENPPASNEAENDLSSSGEEGYVIYENLGQEALAGPLPVDEQARVEQQANQHAPPANTDELDSIRPSTSQSVPQDVKNRNNNRDAYAKVVKVQRKPESRIKQRKETQPRFVELAVDNSLYATSPEIVTELATNIETHENPRPSPALGFHLATENATYGFVVSRSAGEMRSAFEMQSLEKTE